MTKPQAEADYRFNWLSTHLSTDEETRAFASDALLLHASQAVLEAMNAANMNRAQLAAAIGKSKSHVSQVLSGERNMTLRTLADLLWACEQEVASLELQRLGDMRVPCESLNRWLNTESIHRLAAEQIVDSDDKGFVVRIDAPVKDHEPVAA